MFGSFKRGENEKETASAKKPLSLLNPSGQTAQLGEIMWDRHVVMQRVNGKI